MERVKRRGDARDDPEHARLVEPTVKSVQLRKRAESSARKDPVQGALVAEGTKKRGQHGGARAHLEWQRPEQCHLSEDLLVRACLGHTREALDTQRVLHRLRLGAAVGAIVGAVVARKEEARAHDGARARHVTQLALQHEVGAARG